MRTSSPFHAVTWLLWAVAAASCVQVAPSPVYVALVVAASALVVEAHGRDTTLARAFPILISVAIVFAVLRVTLTALTTHSGSPLAVTWFTLPSGTLPQALGGFEVGGSIEQAVVLRALTEAFAVVGIMAAFGAFNAVASHHELLGSAPRAFHEPGLIVTVGLAFIPSTLAAITAVREADRARTGGTVVRRRRLVRLTIPILESGMERAVALAESMDARGFARMPATKADKVAGWTGLGSLAGLAATMVLLVQQDQGWALAVGGLATAGLVASVWLASSGDRPSRYRPRALARRDYLVGGVAVLAPVGLVVAKRLVSTSLTWATNDPLRFPSFHVVPALCLLLLVLPAAFPPVAQPAAPSTGDLVQQARTRREPADLVAP